MEKLTIITPTFNRAHSLPKLYDSLCNQTRKDFIWLIMDDGSTDSTDEIVNGWQRESLIKIEYYRHDNVHKVVTMFRGFEKIKTKFHFQIDSDDTIPSDSVEILLRHAEAIEDDDEFLAVIGRIQNQNNTVLGTPFPTDPLDTTAFLMRYKYKALGPHMGIQKTELIRKLKIDMEQYAGKGYLPDFWNYIIDKHYKTRFVNDVIYTYYWDLNDEQSNTNNRKRKKYAFGLMLSHLAFVESYYELYFEKYPVPVLKQLFKYFYYGLNTDETSVSDLFKKLKFPLLKLIGFGMFPFVLIYNLLKPMEK